MFTENIDERKNNQIWNVLILMNNILGLSKKSQSWGKT